jgi:hypothetical protein
MEYRGMAERGLKAPEMRSGAMASSRRSDETAGGRTLL